MGLISTPLSSPHFFIHLSCCSWMGCGMYAIESFLPWAGAGVAANATASAPISTATDVRMLCAVSLVMARALPG